MSTNHPSLRNEPSNLIAGQWHPIPGGDLVSHNPAHPSQVVWQGSPAPEHVDAAVGAARAAMPAWSRTPFDQRVNVLRRYAAIARSRAAEVAALITDENRQELWETPC